MIIVLLIAIVLTGESSAVPARRRPPSIDFKEGFKYCCPYTAQLLSLPNQWIANCLKQYGNFQKGYDQTSAIYYRAALRGLGMKGATYNNSVFWSSNDVSDIFDIINAIAPWSPPSSSNIPSGAFGNCINEVYEYADIITYWFEYSKLMARKSASYSFWLTTGDESIYYFPNQSRPSIFETYELSNLKPPRVPGLTVLNARSYFSKGLTCAQDTKSRNKLKSVNSRLVYYCCDLSLTSASALYTINKVIKGMHYVATCIVYVLYLYK